MQPAELQYVNNDGDSQLISKLNTIAKASVVENIITYKNAYGPGIDLMFTVSTSGVKKEVVIQSFDILPLPLIPDSSLEVNIEFSTSSEISVYASETLNDEERQLWKGETIYPKGAIQFKDTNPNSIDRNYDRKIDEDDTIVFESSTAIARDSAEEIAYIDSDTGGLALILQKIDDIKRTSVRTQYNWLKNANYPVYIDPSIGPKNPSSAATLVDGVASFAWSNATNIFTSNNQDASATVHAVVPTWPLYASGFGFDVPSNSIITGIQARYERAATSTTIIDGVISLVKDGNIVGDNKAGASWPLVDAYRTVGASNDLWGVTWTPAEVNASSFGLAIKPFLPSGTGGIAYVDHVQMTIYYTIPPEITVSPSVNYGGFTRLGSNNTPVILSFTAVDDETTGVNQLAYQIRTAAGGNGTLVGNGTATSGQNKTHNISNTDPGLTDGTQTLYLRVSDGTSWSNDASFTLLRDTSESAASIPTHSPSPVTATKQFTITFTPSDTYSTGSNELSYQIRTASGGSGSLLASGNSTSGNPVTTGTITDSTLVHGRKYNQRYLRITDGAGNVYEKEFQILVEIPFPTPTPRPTGSFEGFSAEGIRIEGIRFD